MPKFDVTFTAKTKFLMVIEAEDEDDAWDKAEDVLKTDVWDPDLKRMDPLDWIEVDDVDRVDPYGELL